MANGTVDLGALEAKDLYWGLTTGFSILTFGLWFISYLRTRKILWFPESAALLIIGTLLGLLLRFQGSDTAAALDGLVQFNGNIFFIIFLPPIVFEAAYSFPNIVFANNVLLICLLAFLGTTLTMIFTGMIMNGISQGANGSILQMSLVDNLLFGAGISATDPVAVLIVFSTLGADKTLFALVLGESVLNDAVALVLYDTTLQFQDAEASASVVIIAILTFCGIFIASMAIGSAVGFLASLFFKTMRYYKYPEASRIECGLLIAIPYASYFLAQASGFSGITSISFCGIVLSEYASTSLSKIGKEFNEVAYGALAQTFEAFTFIFMGIAFVNLIDTDPAVIKYALAAFGAILIARAAHVIICVFLGNLARPRETQINVIGTFALFVVGLRGPMAFYVSVQAANDLDNKTDGAAIKTITIILICITTPLIGFIMPYLVKIFKLNVEGSCSSGGWPCFHWRRGEAPVMHDAEAEVIKPMQYGCCTRLFFYLNRRFLLPIFATPAEVNGEVEKEDALQVSDESQRPVS